MTDLPKWESDAPRDFAWTEKAFDFIVSGQLAVSIVSTTHSQLLRVEGDCPRCYHDVAFSIPTTAPFISTGLGTLADRANPETEIDEYPVECRCTGTHTDRPADKASGCGIYFTVALLGSSAA